jgi:predicted metal-dependent peptidase
MKPDLPKPLMKARAGIVLDHPFFASILLKHPMEEDNTIPTCCVNGAGRVKYNRAFFDSLPVAQATWAACHEILHYAGMDSLRVGARDPGVWNEVCDAWINDTLAEMKIGEPVPGCINQPGASKFTKEQLYDQKMKENGNRGGGNQPGGNGNQPGGGGQQPPPPQPTMSDDVEPSPATDSETKEQEGQVKMEIAEAAQAAKMRGNLPGILQKMVHDTINSKVPWYDVLERFMTERVKNAVSWARPNRRYAPEFYLPVVDGVGAMGEMVVQVDISGSVSKEEIKHYNGHMKRIVEQCHPSKVHVIYTDTEVQLHEEFEKPEELEITYHSGGGTDMVEGLRYCERRGITPEVFITLTDGYTDFPTLGQFDTPQVWCISSDKKSPVGENINFSMGD